MIGTNRYIGSPIERIEDLRFLRGRGQFVGDLKRESMLHAAILRSPVAHGLVAAVDASAALWLYPHHRTRPNQVAVVHDADECQDETILRIYGGHMVRVPCSLEEVLGWFG